MDQVTITDISDRVSTIDVFGPESARALAGQGLGTLPAPGTTQTVSTGPYHLVCLGLDQSISLGWRVIFPTDQQPTLIDRLDSLGGHFLDVSAYERLRIEKGLPGAGSELVEEYTPLEAGLAQAVSQSKGCYTGQEVLARQINYEKITQTLCGLKLDRPLAPGQALYKDGQPAGRLTSITKSGRLGWIGLGVIKRPHNQEGTLLSTSSSDQADGLWVCALPFTTNQLI
jgi:folate-binding protein YgfZ